MSARRFEPGPQPQEPGRIVAVEVPLAGSDQDVRSHVDLNLNVEQAQGLERLRAGLESHHARLKNGRPVHSAADACRWICESLAAASETPDATGGEATPAA